MKGRVTGGKDGICIGHMRRGEVWLWIVSHWIFTLVRVYSLSSEGEMA